MPTENNLEIFISDFILDAARRCFKYAVELEFNRIPVWTGAAQASTQTGFDINFPISPRHGNGISLGKSKGSYELKISGDELDVGFNSGLKYFEYLDENAGRSTTSPWNFKDKMWEKFNEHFNFIVETEYEQKLIGFIYG